VDIRKPCHRVQIFHDTDVVKYFERFNIELQKLYISSAEEKITLLLLLGN